MSKGLTNLGNTCYMNSALQCLIHLPYLFPDNKMFITDCKRRFEENDFSLMREWFKLQKNMWIDKDKKVINTSSFIKTFINQCRKKDIYFESFVQNDAQEFITIIIDLFHESIKRKVRINVSGTPLTNYDLMKIKSIESWKNFFEDNYSYIIKHFYSKLYSKISCPNCKYHTNNYEPISTITLSLNTGYDSIYNCLDEFIRKETLDTDNSWKCDKCHVKVCPFKEMKFFELSSILIFSIKQFRRGLKINQHINFPEYLDMREYSIGIQNNGYKYRLYGICVHQGGLNGGHYYAMCYNSKTDQWLKCNDTHVEGTTINNVLKETPYCFFYVREN